MMHTFLKLEFKKRILIFLAVATSLAFLSLYAAIQVGYPNGSTPRLQGYCCGYCENGTECVEAAIGEEGISKEEVCSDRRAYENKKGNAIAVPIAPVDTWTNLVYLVIALLPFAQRIRTSSITTLFSVFTLALGFGSGLFHAGGSATGQLADMLGIFLVFGLLGAHAIQMLFRKQNDLLVILLTVALIIMQFYLREVKGDMVALVTIGIIILTPLFIRSDTRQLKFKILISMVIFAVAEAFRQLDGRFGEIFGENSIIQAHGIWHVISAIGIGYVFWVEQEIMGEKLEFETI